MVLPVRLTAVAIGVGVAWFGCASKPAQSEQPSSGGPVVEVEAEPDDGPAPTEVSTPDQSLEIDGVRLGLHAADCVLQAESGAQVLVHRFEYPGACAFASDASGAVRVVETEQGKAVMVESSRPLERDCETATRVVVITKQGPRVSKAAQRVAMCAPFQWDTMMFHVLASEPVEFGTPSVDP
jgi:hypothetical protein